MPCVVCVMRSMRCTSIRSPRPRGRRAVSAETSVDLVSPAATAKTLNQSPMAHAVTGRDDRPVRIPPGGQTSRTGARRGSACNLPTLWLRDVRNGRVRSVPRAWVAPQTRAQVCPRPRPTGRRPPRARLARARLCARHTALEPMHALTLPRHPPPCHRPTPTPTTVPSPFGSLGIAAQHEQSLAQLCKHATAAKGARTCVGRDGELKVPALAALIHNTHARVPFRLPASGRTEHAVAHLTGPGTVLTQNPNLYPEP